MKIMKIISIIFFSLLSSSIFAQTQNGSPDYTGKYIYQWVNIQTYKTQCQVSPEYANKLTQYQQQLAQAVKNPNQNEINTIKQSIETMIHSLIQRKGVAQYCKMIGEDILATVKQ